MQDWEQDLDGFFPSQGEERRPPVGDMLIRRNQEAGQFIQAVVLPAFEEVRRALEQYGRVALLRDGRSEASLRVRHGGRDEFEYVVKTRVTPERAYPFVETITYRGWLARKGEVPLRDGAQEYGVADVSKDEIIRHLLAAYKAGVAPNP